MISLVNSLVFKVLNSHKCLVNGIVQKKTFGMLILVFMMNLKQEDLIRTLNMEINTDTIEMARSYMMPFIDMLKNVLMLFTKVMNK